ncbi:MAG: thermonuclease family protein [Planctomycetota bacterium]
MMNRKLFLPMLGILLPVALAVGAAEFVGSRQRNTVHDPSCEWAQKIIPRNRVTFPSVEEAVTAGYRPCGTCLPNAATPPSGDTPAPTPDGGESAPSATEEAVANLSGATISSWGRAVTVTDGDTLVMDDGKRKWKVRLHGINTPEKGEPGAAEAKQALADLVLEKPIFLLFEERKKDGYNRLLAYVYVIGGNTDLVSVAARLLAAGRAKVYLKYPCMFQSQFLLLEEEARRAGIGIWAGDGK